MSLLTVEIPVHFAILPFHHFTDHPASYLFVTENVENPFANLESILAMIDEVHHLIKMFLCQMS